MGLDYNPRTGSHVLEDTSRMVQPVATDTPRQQARELAIAAAEELFRRNEEEANERFRLSLMTPTERRSDVERNYIPKLREAIEAFHSAKAELDNYQSDEQNFIAHAARIAVYNNYTAEGYKRVTSEGRRQYEAFILKDMDLMQNYYEVHRQYIGLAGSDRCHIYYLPRGTVQADLEPAALEAARKLFVDGKPALERKFLKAYEVAEAIKIEFQRKLAELETAESIIADFKRVTAIKAAFEKGSK